MDNIWSYISHYVEYAPGVAVMFAVLWRIDRYFERIVASCIKCWDKDAEGAHDGGKGISNP